MSKLKLDYWRAVLILDLLTAKLLADKGLVKSVSG